MTAINFWLGAINWALTKIVKATPNYFCRVLAEFIGHDGVVNPVTLKNTDIIT